MHESDGFWCCWRWYVLSVQGVVYAGREDLTPDNYLCEVAVDTPKRTLREAVEGADVFLGLSVSDGLPGSASWLFPSLLCLHVTALHG